MKPKVLFRFITAIFILSLLFISCDRDDNVQEKKIEGHWLYSNTETEVAVTNPSIEKTIADYISNYNKDYQISYEFKNDKTYYYYINYAAPLKGIYKPTTKESFILDDTRGIKNMILKDQKLYILNDMKSQIAKDLNIDENQIIKATSIEVYERGLKNKDE